MKIIIKTWLIALKIKMKKIKNVFKILKEVF